MIFTSRGKLVVPMLTIPTQPSSRLFRGWCRRHHPPYILLPILLRLFLTPTRFNFPSRECLVIHLTKSAGETGTWTRYNGRGDHSRLFGLIFKLRVLWGNYIYFALIAVKHQRTEGAKRIHRSKRSQWCRDSETICSPQHPVNVKWPGVFTPSASIAHDLKWFLHSVDKCTIIYQRQWRFSV